jgi:hypothetical protein
MADMANSEYLKRRYSEQREWFVSLLGGRCKRCGTQQQLEIDHIDPSKKKIRLGALFTKKTIVAALIELVEKCQLLCERCHAQKSAEEAMAKARRFEHGTVYGWMKAKCDCQICTTAKWQWHDARNARRHTGVRNQYQTRRRVA